MAFPRSVWTAASMSLSLYMPDIFGEPLPLCTRRRNANVEKQYCVISHTHWDREWYLPFENFRVKLVHLVENLLDVLDCDPEFRFHLDAQTIVLEDYLEIRPEHRGILSEHIRDGRILVGPWYIHNDFFLTSGEATVRNLLIGTDIAEQFGGCTLVGYVPDQFSLISQIPQIFAKCKIDSVIFGRGYSFPDGPRKSEFLWKTRDGSEILGIYLPFWYNNAQRFSADIERSLSLLKRVANQLDGTSTTPYYLLMNGVDHLEAQEDLLPILAKLNALLPPGERISQTTMPDYVAKVKSSVGVLDEYTGEMRNGNKRNILAGTLSSRVYLKQRNIWSQTLLENRLEPLYSLLYASGIHPYPSGFLRYMWKLLLQNHPHDSICGCSVDAVHEHMMDRFKRIEEVGLDMLERGMDTLSSYVNRDGLSPNQYLITVLNTGSAPRTAVVDVDIDFPIDEDPGSFSITDEDASPVSFTVVSRQEVLRDILSPINLPGMMAVASYRVRLLVDQIPGISYRTFVVSPSETPALEAESDGAANTLENEYLKLEVDGRGEIRLTEKMSNRVYENLLAFEDKEDTGHSYIYLDNGHEPILSTQFAAKVGPFVRDALAERCTITYLLRVPEFYDFANKQRIGHTVNIPVVVELTLRKQSEVLEIDVEFENTAKDHRVRALFNTSIQSSFSQAGSPFDVVVRDADALTRGETEIAQQPNTSFVNVDGDDCGLAVLNEGLYEYELIPESLSRGAAKGTANETRGSVLALTLLRGNGIINRDASGLPSSDRWLVPGNQCLGRHHFRLGLYPHKGDVFAANVSQIAQDFLNPLLHHVQCVDVRKFSGGRPFVQDSSLNELFFRQKRYPEVELPRRRHLLAAQSDGVVMSAFKKSQRNDSLIVRFYNPSFNVQTLQLRLPGHYTEVYVVNLLEERQEVCGVSQQNVVSVSFRPKEIVTLELVASNAN